MPKRETRDVEPRANQWAVQREGAARANSLHDHQDDAIKRAIELARRADGQLRVKGKDGQIRDERTYGNDPYPPAG
jgi:Uncharacterized protein conserved in bacteria (DUF2188)